MKHIVITGAGQGIGAEIAYGIARRKQYRLTLVGRTLKKLQQVADGCSKAGSIVEPVALNLADEQQVLRWGMTVGAVDVVVNNAGRFEIAPFESCSAETMTELWRDNFLSSFLVCRAVLPAMKAAGKGNVMFFSSGAVSRAFSGMVGYLAAKAAVETFSEVLRNELKGSGVKTTLLIPGPTASPVWRGTGVEEKDLLNPSDIADTILSILDMDPRTMVERVELRPSSGTLD
jgi:short-subunit dehydrogenase